MIRMLLALLSVNDVEPSVLQVLPYVAKRIQKNVYSLLYQHFWKPKLLVAQARGGRLLAA